MMKFIMSKLRDHNTPATVFDYYITPQRGLTNPILWTAIKCPPNAVGTYHKRICDRRRTLLKSTKREESDNNNNTYIQSTEIGVCQAADA